MELWNDNEEKKTIQKQREFIYFCSRSYVSSPQNETEKILYKSFPHTNLLQIF